MAQGLILLGFLAVLVAFFLTRTRRRMGMNVTGRMWLTIMTAVVLIGLTLWAASHQ
jgi:hypothetical protein